jgi:hypothetical protein
MLGKPRSPSQLRKDRPRRGAPLTRRGDPTLAQFDLDPFDSFRRGLTSPNSRPIVSWRSAPASPDLFISPQNQEAPLPQGETVGTLDRRGLLPQFWKRPAQARPPLLSFLVRRQQERFRNGMGQRRGQFT